MPKNGLPTYYEVLTAALNDVADKGYQSPEQVDYWAQQLKEAAERSMKSIAEVEVMVRDAMGRIFQKQVVNGAVLRVNPGVSKFTLEMIKPALHQELSNRIAASIDLIKLNRTKAIEEQTQRFKGWATSVPTGGTPTTGSRKLDKPAQKADLRKSLKQLPFVERRVLIDQGQKLFAAIDTTVAVNGGAIAGEWQAHGAHQRGYDGRPAHTARDGKIFLVRDSWAHEAGLVKPNSNGYTDEVEQPAEFIFCRCRWVHKFSLRSLPTDMLTEKGKTALAEARKKILANA